MFMSSWPACRVFYEFAVEVTIAIRLVEVSSQLAIIILKPGSGIAPVFRRWLLYSVMRGDGVSMGGLGRGGCVHCRELLTGGEGFRKDTALSFQA